MKSHYNVTTDSNISQTVILEKFIKYLSLRNRSSSLIKDMDSGHCMGFTVLAMYALHMELTQKKNPRLGANRQPVQRDDWRWMRSALLRLSKWDGTEASLEKQTRSGRMLRRDTERLIGLIEHFQSPGDHESSSQMQIHKNLESTRGKDFFREYAFSGIFTLDEFTRQFSLEGSKTENRKTTLIDELIKENRMVFVACVSHVVGVIKHKDIYYFYDSNNQYGWTVYPEDKKSELSKEIFETLYSAADIQKQMPFNFNILAKRSDIRTSYPAQGKLFSSATQTYRVSGEDEFQPTALYMAADVGCVELVKYHITNPPMPLKQYVDTACADGDTPLHAASREGFTAAVSHLIDAGASLDVVNKIGSTPLYMAVNGYYYNTAKLLLEKGANPNASTENNFTALYDAVSKNSIELVKLLLSFGARVNQKAYQGNTALHKAVQENYKDLFTLLLKKGANVNARNANDESPFSVAMEFLQFDMIEDLLSVPGIHLNQKDYNALIVLTENFSSNQQLQRCLHKAQPVYMMSMIKEQVSLMNTSERSKKHLIASLKKIKHEVNESKIDEKEKMLFLLKRTLPILESASNASSYYFWQSPPLVTPVLKFAKQIGITPTDIANYQRTSRLATPAM